MKLKDLTKGILSGRRRRHPGFVKGQQPPETGAEPVVIEADVPTASFGTQPGDTVLTGDDVHPLCPIAPQHPGLHVNVGENEFGADKFVYFVPLGTVDLGYGPARVTDASAPAEIADRLK